MLSSRLTLTSAIVLMTGCREPTQVQIELSTDALCDDVRDTSITISATGELEQALSDTSTNNCSTPAGRIGSLTIVPAGDEDAEFGVRVVTGLGKSAAQCSEDGYLGGCIVARRSLRFIPHKTLHLPIEMGVVCRDIPCGATQTCSNGRCVDAAIADVTACLDPKGCTFGAAGAAPRGGTTDATSGGHGGAASSRSDPKGGSIHQPTSVGGQTSNVSGTATDNTASGGSLVTSSGIPHGGTPTVTFASSAIGGNGTGGAAIGTTQETGVGGTTTASGGESATGGLSATSHTPAVAGTAGVTSSPMSAGGSSAAGGTTATGGTTASGGSQTVGGTSSTTGLPAVCGDGILNPYAGEYCDTPGDPATCNTNCTPSRCGDGLVNPAAGEVCDGSSETVHCTPTCRLSTCGDSYVDTLTGEQCESGMGGCNACTQDLAGRTDALRVLAERDELLLDTLSLNLEIQNTGQAIPIAGLVLRYYYTPDSNNTQSTNCTWSNAGCSNVSLQVATLTKSCTQASHYVQIGFKGSASLPRNESLSVQAGVSGGLLSIYNFSNDYSRPQSSLFKTETPEIALYHNGRLVWGTPPCGCGNGTLDGGEQCDHGGESAYCNSDCTLARCGDGKVNAKAGENCDTNAPSLTCNPECRATGLPASAAAALLQWLDASVPSSITLSPHVARVLDRSGRSNHVLQSIPEKQPYWFPAAFGTQPAFYFDGKLHELVAGSSVSDKGLGSVLLVHHVVPVGLSATLLGNGWFGSGGGFAIRTRPQLDGLGIALGSSNGYATVQWTAGASAGSSPPNPRATYWSWDPPTFTWSTAGITETLTVSANYTSTAAPFALGGVAAEEPFTGWISELLMFDRELTAAERDAILAYLRNKWGVL